MEILLYTPKLSNRLDYISSFIFNTILKKEYNITTQKSAYLSFTGVKINYSNRQITDQEVWIKPHSLLFEKTICKQDIQIVEWQNIHTFFCIKTEDASPIIAFPSQPLPPKGEPQPVTTIWDAPNTDQSFPFDIFASSFYLLSRYEEYLPYKKDQHGRFSASESLGSKEGFLERPMIHEWVRFFTKFIQKKNHRFSLNPTEYKFKPTYDIDIPWAFRHRGARGWARTGLDLLQAKWPLLKSRYHALLDEKKDPFFCFSAIKEQHQRLGIRPRIFWLIGNSSRQDTNPDYRLKAFQNLIRQTDQWSDSGLHPSYQSNEHPLLLGIEKTRLENILKRPITTSRQHFLRLHLPDTYQQLIDIGIKDDYSMGFSDQVGYRAGTSESFFWYDLMKDKATTLRIHPFVAMDVTLKNYEKHTAEQAYIKLKELQTYAQNNGLTFRTLWHNSSFSKLHGWEGWEDIYWKLFE